MIRIRLGAANLALWTALALTPVFALTGCDDDPAEDIGEAIDDAAEEVEDALDRD